MGGEHIVFWWVRVLKINIIEVRALFLSPQGGGVIFLTVVFDFDITLTFYQCLFCKEMVKLWCIIPSNILLYMIFP